MDYISAVSAKVCGLWSLKTFVLSKLIPPHHTPRETSLVPTVSLCVERFISNTLDSLEYVNHCLIWQPTPDESTSAS